jgi:hypothetical protein
MKNSLFAPDCARRRVQRPTAAQRRLLGRRKRVLGETKKRLRSEAKHKAFGVPQKTVDFVDSLRGAERSLFF